MGDNNYFFAPSYNTRTAQGQALVNQGEHIAQNIGMRKTRAAAAESRKKEISGISPGIIPCSPLFPGEE
jgi:hypothetical protein